jgi:hypothetical protein
VARQHPKSRIIEEVRWVLLIFRGIHYQRFVAYNRVGLYSMIGVKV